MNIPYRYMLIVFFLFLFQFQTPATAADFSGTWYGPYFYDHVDTDGLSGQLTVVITQNDSAISGTFTSGTGSTGTFSGVADGEQFVGNLTSLTESNKAIATFVAKLHRGILVWEGIGSSDNTIRSLSGALTKNWVQDASHWLSVSKYSYPSNFMEGDVWAFILEPAGKPIESVMLVTPLLDEMPVIDWDEDDSRFEGDYNFDISNVEIVYPNGIYSFIINFGDGSSGACFSTQAGNFSEQIPQILSPVPDTLVDETNVLPVLWNQWLNPDSHTNIGVYFDIGHYMGLTNDATQYELPANTLSDNMMEWLKISFNRPSGYYAKKSVTARSYLRTSSHKVDDHWLGKVKVHLPSGQIAGGLIVGMDAAGVSSATLIPPAGATGSNITIVQGEKLNGSWESWYKDADFDNLNTKYPDGQYILRLIYKDATQEDITMTLGGDYPSSIPNITQPANLSDLIWWKSFPAQWTNWEDFDNADTFIVSTLDIMDSTSEADYLSSVEVWGNDEGILSNGMIVSPGIMKSGNAYAYTVIFLQETGVPGVLKGTGDVVFLETPDIPTSTLTVSLSGTGKGSVHGYDGVISCDNTGGVCQAEYNRNQQVILLPVPEKGSVFAGWTGDADCLDGVATMTENKNCIATFNKVNIIGLINLLLLE